jgi:hypothetical protein
MRRLLLALGVLLVAAVPAQAEDPAELATALRAAPVYQAPGLDLVDVATLTSELADTNPRLYVAVLPATAASAPAQAKELAVAIGTALAESDDVVLVITANGKFGTGQGDVAKAHGVDSAKALTEELKSLHTLTKDTLTAFVLSFAERVANQVATTATPGVQFGDVPVVTGGGSGTGWLVGGSVVVLLGLAAAAIVLPRRLRRAEGA